MTGLRIGEICALKWRNISTEEGLVKIEHTIQRIKDLSANSQSRTKIIISKHKTHHSQRIIPLSTDCIRLCENIGSFEAVGFELKSLSEILGHASTRITLDRYVHSSLQTKRENMEKLPTLLANKSSNSAVMFE
jgi:integrase